MSSSSAASKSFHRSDRNHIPHGHSLSSSSSSSLSKSVDGTLSVRNKSMAPPPRRSATPNPRPRSRDDDGAEPARVRVAIRVRPKTSEEEADFTDCVELQPELKRLKLIKNNWNSESYRFDELFSETASQRRVYEVVAKPVVESVLNGFNGTVMAYGQTGTGKTYTIGRLGKEDVSERGIIVRALEDIIASTSGSSDIVEVSYLQLYLESVQDLLAPERTNIPIVEDHKTGEVTLPGASVVKIQDVDHFLQVLQLGESNRQVANTRMNTESSRSHAIFMIYVRRSIHEKEENHSVSGEKRHTDLMGEHGIPTVHKSKMLIVDLAGSERLNKSGSEGHLVEETKFINLSLTSLGKCINALAENSPHIPTRDSKLTRLLRDSFGGSARTSLIVTISPSSRHLAETTSTIMFGQRTMKVMNMVKLKEEFDYESYCRKLGNEMEHLTAEVDRQQKARDNMKIEMEIKLKECQKFYSDTERSLIMRSEFLEKENALLETEMKAIVNELIHVKDHNVFMHNEVDRLETSLNQSKQELEHLAYQQVLADTIQMYETKISDLMNQLSGECTRSECSEAQLDVMKKQEYDHQRSMQNYQVEISSYQKALADTTQLYEKKIKDLEHQLNDMHAQCGGMDKEIDIAETHLHEQQNSMQLQRQEEFDELKVKLQEIHGLHEMTIDELESLRHEYNALLVEKASLKDDICGMKHDLQVEESKRKAVETELLKFKKLVPGTDDDFEDKILDMNENSSKPLGLHKSKQSREIIFGQRATIAKLCEEVGLEKILHLLSSCDLDVQIHAVKMVANLAAEDDNQEKIVAEGGLDALLMLLQTSENTTILRVASGAVANLAMNEMNQNLIMSKGGGPLLAMTSSKTNDPQTLRMVAGAIANLCGNEKLHVKLVEDGTIKSLLGMVRSGNNDVIAQVARGLANFSKCESRGIIKGHRKGRSLLMGDGALTWLIANNTTTSTVPAPTRRHIELALCHLAQNEDNAKDFIYSGGVKELERISNESTREDIRSLAKKTLNMSPVFKVQILRAS
ncbi:kinesin-like protein KIN-UC isoform X2 [Impatiens glandulifera]|uniref:kinesin-like protein KIN-UC isoform X2 n=1 Tax=Impatiens glandulifera TaxID=253017 RepID=UPI001FB06C36|nr:kinesin-like protein KIN-UC isoform X2 [Impatiens glandulifera]